MPLPTATAIPPTASPAALPTPVPTTSVTPVPGASEESGPSGACTAAQVEATPGESGAAAGTSYLAVTFTLVGGEACAVPRGPNLALTANDGTVLVHDTDADPRPITLADQLEYRIGWNVGCGVSVPRPTLASIELYSGAVISVPIGDFGPSCVDGSAGRLFMVTDAP